MQTGRIDFFPGARFPAPQSAKKTSMIAVTSASLVRMMRQTTRVRIAILPDARLGNRPAMSQGSA
jgi:hypothetical protein